MARGRTYFTGETLAFLRDLRANNDRDWFNENRERYDAHVKEPAVRFIMDFEPHLQRISSQFLADPRPVGGSLFRIHRDTRFSKDKSPYKTHTGIRFPHVRNRDVHAPGFYLHVEPGEAFIGVGIWQPDAPTLKKIRDAIVDDPGAWKRARDGRRFKAAFDQGGEALSRAPRGYDPEHPYVDDLKRKDFVAYRRVSDDELLHSGFLAAFSTACADAAPFVKYLCGATKLPF